MISFFNEDVDMPNISEQKEKWLSFVIDDNKKNEGELNFIFCSDAYLLDINQKYLQHDYYTDIITFDYCENDIISGDIFISTERVAENAEKFNVSFDSELSRILVHGVLHLLGQHDKAPDDKKEMTRLEDKYLSLMINY